MDKGSKPQLKNKRWVRIICLSVVIVIVALFLEAGILYNVNAKNADNTSEVFLKQIISILEKNDQTEKEMMRSLKEDYIVRAKAVS